MAPQRMQRPFKVVEPVKTCRHVDHGSGVNTHRKTEEIPEGFRYLVAAEPICRFGSPGFFAGFFVFGTYISQEIHGVDIACKSETGSSANACLIPIFPTQIILCPIRQIGCCKQGQRQANLAVNLSIGTDCATLGKRSSRILLFFILGLIA